jgi:hypothetical protein
MRGSIEFATLHYVLQNLSKDGSFSERIYVEQQMFATLSSIFQILSAQSYCSGFIRHERKQVTLGRSKSTSVHLARSNEDGYLKVAKCKFSSAAARNIASDRSEIWLALFALGAHTSMSSSGGKIVLKRSSEAIFAYNASAAARAFDKPRANSPFGTRGNNFWVAQSATADAPALEHSRLISPRCSSEEVK